MTNPLIFSSTLIYLQACGAWMVIDALSSGFVHFEKIKEVVAVDGGDSNGNDVMLQHLTL